MKLAAIFLVFLLSKAVGMDATELKGTASRIDGGGNEFSIRINYETMYEAKLGVQKGHMLKQRIVRFYEGAKHVGSYYYWQEVGSGLPSATTSRDLQVKPAKFTEVRITDRFYDVNWHDGRWMKKSLEPGSLRRGISSIHAIQKWADPATTFVRSRMFRAWTAT